MPQGQSLTDPQLESEIEKLKNENERLKNEIKLKDTALMRYQLKEKQKTYSDKMINVIKGTREDLDWLLNELVNTGYFKPTIEEVKSLFSHNGEPLNNRKPIQHIEWANIKFQYYALDFINFLVDNQIAKKSKRKMFACFLFNGRQLSTNGGNASNRKYEKDELPCFECFDDTKLREIIETYYRKITGKINERAVMPQRRCLINRSF
jgi:hypothetical protein